jgi:transposase
MSDLFGVAGTDLLDQLRLEPQYAARIRSLRHILDVLDFEIEFFAKMIAAQLVNHPGYRAIQALDGIGPVLAAILVAEIGDVTRFARPEQLWSWAGADAPPSRV